MKNQPTYIADAVRGILAGMSAQPPGAHKHVISFSGGAGSWAAAKRVVAKYGARNVVLLFADTLIEDADLYRFLKDAARNIGVPITRIADGRTPWQVFEDVRFIGNSRVDPCSMHLKRDLIRAWLDANCDPSRTTVYVGLGWYEPGRVEKLMARNASNKFRHECPMAEGPFLDPDEVLAWMEREGIRRPALYAEGFTHNNCGGFCVKAGQAHFKLLLDKRRDYYLFNESEEERLRALGINGTVLTDRRGGAERKAAGLPEKIPLTLRQFRLRVEGGGQFDANDVGGCGCAVGDDVPPQGMPYVDEEIYAEENGMLPK